VRGREPARARGKWVGLPLASALLAGGGIAAPAPDADQGMLEDVVVTAQKRSEDLQKVPISLQVLSGEMLEEHHVSSFDDYAKFLPSVSYQSTGPGQSQLYFRGIASGNDGLHAGSLPATGVYLDEIPVTTIGNTLDIHTYDIARVEALAGPQGTLYGASSLSGTLRIITNKPDPTKFSAGYDLKADKFGRGNGGGEVEGFVNIPLTDKMAIRLVGFYDHQGGYINNVLVSNTIDYGVPAAGIPNTPVTYTNASAVKKRANDVDTYGGRAALKIDLNDNWTIMPQLISQGQMANGNFEYNPRLGNLNVDDYQLGDNQDRWYQSALTVEGKVANFDIVYSGGWFERKVDNVVDYSGYTIGYDANAQLPAATSNYNSVFLDPNTGAPLYPMQYVANHDKYTKMSHELRVSSPADLPFRATGGLFYQRQTNNIRAEFRGDQLPDVYAVDGSPKVYYLSQQLRADRDYAAFTEMTYDVTSQFKISGGIRKFYVNNTLYGFFGFKNSKSGEGACNPPVSAATIVPNYWPCINTDKKVVENGETHKINLTYQIDPDRMVYTTYSTGFRPGGNNRRLGVAPYGADTLTNIEGGWKTSWFQNRIRWNGALFFERWKGVQYSITGANGITSIINTGNAAVKGVESDLSWLALDSLTLTASGTYVNARITQNFCDVDQVTEAVTHDCAAPNAPAGTPLPVTPRMKGNATARYKFNVGDYESFFQGSVIHQSSSRADLRTLENSEFGDLPAFTTFDFATGTGMHNWTVEAFVENAFDKRGALGRTNACAAAYCYTHYREFAIKPMNFGVKFGQKF
jgi:outer membrane receptor protein involved in Fe transport